MTYWLLVLRDTHTLHILCLFDGKFIRHGLVVTKLRGANAVSIVMMGFCVNRREETFFFLHALTPDNELRFTRTITEIFSLNEKQVQNLIEAFLSKTIFSIASLEVISTSCFSNELSSMKINVSF